VERVPWAEGRNHLTKTYAWFLAHWAKRMSWSDAAAAFRTTSSTGSALEVSSPRRPLRPGVRALPLADALALVG
jgi:hypothetical protein